MKNAKDDIAFNFYFRVHTGVSDGIMEMRFENATTFTKKAISQKILMILTHCKNYVKER